MKTETVNNNLNKLPALFLLFLILGLTPILSAQTLVKAIDFGTYNGSNQIGGSFITDLNGKILFNSGLGDIDGTWISDGTSAGTNVLIGFDISTDVIKPNSGELYFAGYDATNGSELWKTDGTTANTQLIKDIFTGTYSIGINTYQNSSLPRNFFELNGATYFTIRAGYGPSGVPDPGDDVAELWKTDGTAAGTILIQDFSSSIPSVEIRYEPLISNNELIFQVNKDREYFFWKTDGGVDNAEVLFDVSPNEIPANVGVIIGLGDVGVSHFERINNEFFYVEGLYEGGAKLVKSDAGFNGYEILGDSPGGDFDKLVRIGNRFCITGANQTIGKELFVSSINNPSAFTGIDIYVGSESGLLGSELYKLGDKVLFAADDGINGKELWISDGTSGGTMLLKDINPGSNGSDIRIIKQIDHQWYFLADDGVHGLELWKTDGTTAGTVMVVDFENGNNLGPNIADIFAWQNELYLLGNNDGTIGLWKMGLDVNPCTLPTVNVQTNLDCPNQRMEVVVTVSDLGSATSLKLDSYGTVLQSGITAPGTYTFYYDFLEYAYIEIIDENNAVCRTFVLDEQMPNGLDCPCTGTPPLATFSFDKDCLNYTGPLVANVTDMGSATSVDIFVNGFLRTTVNSTGTVWVGNYALNSVADIKVVDANDPLCKSIYTYGLIYSPPTYEVATVDDCIAETFDSQVIIYEFGTVSNIKIQSAFGFVYAEANATDPLPVVLTIETDLPFGTDTEYDIKFDDNNQCRFDLPPTAYGSTCPAATINLIDDCDNELFSVEVIVTVLESGTSRKIVIDNQEVVTNITSVPFTYSHPSPFGFGTNVTIDVLDEQNNAHLPLNFTETTNGEKCPNYVTCGTPFSGFQCYENTVEKTYWYKSPQEGVPLKIKFLAGNTTFNDNVTIYDGPDENSPIRYTGYGLGNLTNLERQMQGSDLFLKLNIAYSGTCGQSSFDDWQWEVTCEIPKPTAVCQTPVNVPVNALLYADDLDGGSTDPNNNPLFFSFSAIDVNDNTRIFDCEDVGSQPIKVYVGNAAGGIDSCESTLIIVEPNNYFTGECMPHILSCDDDYSVTALGMPNITHVCDEPFTLTHKDTIVECGTVWRVWTATEDINPNITYACVEVITRWDYFTEVDIIWPRDTHLVACLADFGDGFFGPAYDAPQFTNVGCTEIAVVYQENITSDEFCLELERFWIVTDTCGGDSTWTHTQYLSLENNTVPIFQNPCASQIFCIPEGESCDSLAPQLNVSVTSNCPSDIPLISYEIDYFTDGSIDVTGTGAITNNLPYGNHKVTWTATTPCLTSATCVEYILILDCTPPEAYGLNISTALNPNGEVTLLATDFDLGSSDNCPYTLTYYLNYPSDPELALEFAQPNWTFTCDDVGMNTLDFIVVDSAGNFDLTTVTLTVSDNGNCVGDCPDFILVDDNYDLEAGATLQAADYIQAENTITPFQEFITYQAGNYILLQDGFTVEQGAEFHAVISDCSTPAVVETTPVEQRNSPTEKVAIEDIKLAVFPNPFQQNTTIQYALHKAATVRLAVYAATGQLVQVLADNTWQSAGAYQTVFSGDGLAGGVYLVSLETEEGRVYKKMILVK